MSESAAEAAAAEEANVAEAYLCNKLSSICTKVPGSLHCLPRTWKLN